MKNSFLKIVLVVGSTFTVLACGSNHRDPSLDTTVTEGKSAAQGEGPVADDPAPASPSLPEPVSPPVSQPECLSDSDCIADQTCQDGLCVARAVPLPEVPSSDSLSSAPDPLPPAPAVPDPIPPAPESVADAPAPSTVCGNGTCETGEDEVLCAADCGVPALPEIPVTVSLSGSGADHDIRLGFVKLQWSVTGHPDEIYIYGPWNRKAGDAGCEDVISEGQVRGVVVQETGEDFNAGSPNYENYQQVYGVPGRQELCRDDGSNCQGFSTSETDPIVRCRILLTEPEGVVYTRIHQSSAAFVLVARLADGSFVTTEKNVSIPRPQIENLQVSLRKTQPVMDIAFDYRYAFAPPSVTFCMTAAPAQRDPQSDHSGHYNVSCRIHPALPIYATVWGYGKEVMEEIHVSCETPTASLQNGALRTTASESSAMLCADPASDTCDKTGFVALTGMATRVCTVSRKAAQPKTLFFDPKNKKDDLIPLDTESGPYFKDFKIEGLGVNNCPSSGWINFENPKVATDSSGHVSVKHFMPRSYECYNYQFLVHDFDGGYANGATRAFPYHPRLTAISGTQMVTSLTTLPADTDCRAGETMAMAWLSVTIHSWHLQRINFDCRSSHLTVLPVLATSFASVRYGMNNADAFPQLMLIKAEDEAWPEDLTITCELSGTDFRGRPVGNLGSTTWRRENLSSDWLQGCPVEGSTDWEDVGCALASVVGCGSLW